MIEERISGERAESVPPASGYSGVCGIGEIETKRERISNKQIGMKRCM